MSSPRLPLRFLFCLVGGLNLVASLAAQNVLSPDAEAALKAQTDHFASVTRRGKQVYYPPQFDLSGLPHYRPEHILEGWIRIHGDNYLADGQLGEFWRQGFAKFQPGLRISYYLPTAASGFGGLYYDQSDIIFDHNPTFYDLLAYERIKGTDPVTLTAITGSFDVSGWANSFAIMVNIANPLTKITVDQLDGVFGAERDGGWKGTNWRVDFARGRDKNIRTWGQLGLTGEWADQPIIPYGFAMRYNTAVTFSDKILHGSDKWNERIHTYANYIKADGSRSIEADEIMTSLKDDKYAIAYLLYRGDKPWSKRLAVAPRGTTHYVEHNLVNVQNRAYPLYNEVYMYLSTRPDTPMEPKLREFCLYVLSQEGQAEVQRDGKYLPLTAEVVREMRKKLAGSK
jgi:phosphate transport system substrate-binding protein